jgi:type I restriction enzyme M protein
MANQESKAIKNKREREVEEKHIIPRLRDELGYDTDLMRKNVPIKFGRMTKYADIVFYTIIDEIKKAFLVVESKAPGQKLDTDQAESYAQGFNAPFFVVTDGETWNFYKTGKEGRGSSNLLKTKVHPTKIIGSSKLVKFGSIEEAKRVIRYCHDVIWNEKSSTPEEALKELTKFLIAKIIDEQEFKDHEKDDYDFKIKKKSENIVDIKRRIDNLLKEAKSRDEDLFVDKNPQITLKPYSVIKIVQKLQEYSLSSTDKVEILGELYQELLMNTYIDKIKGQRFTPRNVVDFMVELIDPKLSEFILDPASGTGGFLVSSLRYVKKEIDEAFEEGDITNPKKEFEKYAHDKLYGIDIEPTVVQLAKANMLMNGDGHTNMICHDGLIDTPKNKVIQDIVKKNGGFDIILTNPPFAGSKIDPEILYHYKLAKKGKNQLLQVLFIERCVNLLKNGGRMAIVLPDGILSNASLKHIRDFIREHMIIKSIVSLPSNTFKPYGAGVKTSLIFMQKKKYANEIQKDVIMAEVKNIGYTVSGKSEKEKDLPKIIVEIKSRGGIKW